jgi:hypothetical protein
MADAKRLTTGEPPLATGRPDGLAADLPPGTALLFPIDPFDTLSCPSATAAQRSASSVASEMSCDYGFVKQSGGHVTIYSEEGEPLSFLCERPVPFREFHDLLTNPFARRFPTSHLL